MSAWGRSARGMREISSKTQEGCWQLKHSAPRRLLNTEGLKNCPAGLPNGFRQFGTLPDQLMKTGSSIRTSSGLQASFSKKLSKATGKQLQHNQKAREFPGFIFLENFEDVFERWPVLLFIRCFRGQG